eukprot:CAMPEP_0113958612 /NCGR_PEP_ID=MMETSP0011_2-20120614/3558_1 /TAXON_ID=101924 /ORGANISM="Rhodosorus marinus" /LENGTH=217 /DNA_ID=CAMNT_0000969577 /DNA_START=133 /DNA_END=783 /DNA_ORIENTATION=- /assembly_acc=CAM_ASM_000156
MRAHARFGACGSVLGGAESSMAFVGVFSVIRGATGGRAAIARRQRRMQTSSGRFPEIVRDDRVLDPGESCLEESTQGFFRMRKKIYPHDTDYSGSVWHGQYVRFFEEARIQMLEECGVDYGRLVLEDCIELPVVEMELKYHKPALMGDEAVVLLRFERKGRLRLRMFGELRRLKDNELLVTSSVILAPIDMKTKIPVRKWPEHLTEASNRAESYGTW